MLLAKALSLYRNKKQYPSPLLLLLATHLCVERIFSSTVENLIALNVGRPSDGETIPAGLVEQRVGSLKYGCHFVEGKIGSR